MRGEKSDLSFLAERCTLPELTVIVRNGTYILTSSLISSIADLDTVRSRLTTLLAMLNGLMRLCRIDSLPVRVGPLTRLRNDGTTDQIIWAGIAADWLTVSASPEQDRQFLGAGFPLALSNRGIESALTVLAEETPTWAQLYLVHELLKADTAGRECLAAQSKEVERFKHTANCYETLGIDARHAPGGIKSPEKPMAWSRALSLMAQLVREWIGRQAKPPPS